MSGGNVAPGLQLGLGAHGRALLAIYTGGDKDVTVGSVRLRGC